MFAALRAPRQRASSLRSPPALVGATASPTPPSPIGSQGAGSTAPSSTLEAWCIPACAARPPLVFDSIRARRRARRLHRVDPGPLRARAARFFERVRRLPRTRPPGAALRISGDRCRALAGGDPRRHRARRASASSHDPPWLHRRGRGSSNSANACRTRCSSSAPPAWAARARRGAGGAPAATTPRRRRPRLRAMRALLWRLGQPPRPASSRARGRDRRGGGRGRRRGARQGGFTQDPHRPDPRAAVGALAVTGHHGSRRVVLLDPAEAMNGVTANALLRCSRSHQRLHLRARVLPRRASCCPPSAAAASSGISAVPTQLRWRAGARVPLPMRARCWRWRRHAARRRASAQGGGAAMHRALSVRDIAGLQGADALRLAGQWDTWLRSEGCARRRLRPARAHRLDAALVSDLAALRLGGRVRFFPAQEGVLAALASRMSVAAASAAAK